MIFHKTCTKNGIAEKPLYTRNKGCAEFNFEFELKKNKYTAMLR